MTVSSTEVRWQNRRVHVPDYGSSHVAVKQHESREGTREKDQDDKTSQSLSAKNIYMRRNHLICNVIKKLAGFAFTYRNVPAVSRSSCSEISEGGLLCPDRTRSRRQVFIKRQGPNSPTTRHRQNTSTWVQWFYCGNEAHGNEQVNIDDEWCYLKTLGKPSEHLSKLTNTHSCIVAALFVTILYVNSI